MANHNPNCRSRMLRPKQKLSIVYIGLGYNIIVLHMFLSADGFAGFSLTGLIKTETKFGSLLGKWEDLHSRDPITATFFFVCFSV